MRVAMIGAGVIGELRSAVMDERHEAALSRLGRRIRVAGGAEIGGGPDRRRDSAQATSGWALARGSARIVADAIIGRPSPSSSEGLGVERLPGQNLSLS